MSHRPSLEDSWVERIFDHMSGLYGSKFADLWRGSDPKVVRGMWGQKLAGFAEMPEAIREALRALDDKPFPPTLPEFIGLCREAGRRIAPVHRPQLEHTPTPEEVARAEEAARHVKETVAAMPKRDPLKWAKDLKEREMNGDPIDHLQAKMWREALGFKGDLK